MKRITSIFLAMTLCGALHCSADARTAYSRLEGDTLVIGNNLIERKFLWNDGNIITRQITDKKNGFALDSHSDTPDFIISTAGQTRPGVYRAEVVEPTSIRPGYLAVTVEYSLGGLDIRRVYRVYENTPAIALDTYLKGDPAGMIEGAGVEASDLRNVEFPDEIKFGLDFCQLDIVELDGLHRDLKAVEFFDVTDINNTLILERRLLPYRRNLHRGNLLFATDKVLHNGFFYLKEAPCSSVQLAYNGFDFLVEFGKFGVGGLGVKDSDIKPDEWTKAYGCVLGTYDGTELGALKALRAYQKNIRTLLPDRDEMVMMNTWGDRSQDTKVNADFCLRELEAGSRLGISHFQIDDGWQVGRTPNSAFSGGSFQDIWARDDYWKPNPAKFPDGLAPIVERGRQLGIEVCLWFNPSVQDNFANWERDAELLAGLYREHGIRVFKIDGLKIPTKEAEINLRRLFDKVLADTDNAVVFDLDVTSGRRGGYHMFNEYGNIFLENRYTDWLNYFPYFTLRNLWHLSRYVPAEKIQVEFLNNRRNADKYGDDPYAPANYPFEYLFAITMAGQPLAWFESTGLYDEAFDAAPAIKKYREIRHDFHSGTILPIGDEPTGNSVTGFQSIADDDRSGYLLIFREITPDADTSITTWLPEGAELEITPLLGTGSVASATVGPDGKVAISMPTENSYLLCKYNIK